MRNVLLGLFFAGMLLAFSLSVADAQLTDLSATWHTSWGPVPGRGGAGSIDMRAVHRNGGIIWTYGDGHTMVCVIDRLRCSGSWVGSSGSGWLELAFAPDGRSFSGTWGYGLDHAAMGTIGGTR